ncbi:MAG: cytochrome b5-like heme/steroid binding domain-containing protein [Nanoarchaeota archaeon]
MAKTRYLILILLLAFVIIGVTFFLGLNKSSGNATLNFGSAILTQGNTSSSSGITFNELAKHSSENDCWVGFQGKAYDITSWLPRHPGSAGAISPYCGTAKEFEDAFTKKHGTSKVSLFMKVATYMGDIKGRGNLQ